MASSPSRLIGWLSKNIKARVSDALNFSDVSAAKGASYMHLPKPLPDLAKRLLFFPSLFSLPSHRSPLKMMRPWMRRCRCRIA